MDNIDMDLIGNSPAAPLVIFIVAIGNALAGDGRTHNQFRNAFSQLREAADLADSSDRQGNILLNNLNWIAEGAINWEDVRNLEDLIDDMESIVCRP